MQFTGTTHKDNMGDPYRVDTYQYPSDIDRLIALECFLNETNERWTLVQIIPGPDNIVIIHKKK